MKIWISDDGLVRKTEDYSYSGQHVRTVAFPEYQQIGGRFIPKTVVIVDELRGAMLNGVFVKERTTYTSPVHRSIAFRTRPSRKPGWNSSVNSGGPGAAGRGRHLAAMTAALLFLVLVSPRVFAQDQQSGSIGGDTDIDNLFNGGGARPRRRRVPRLQPRLHLPPYDRTTSRVTRGFTSSGPRTCTVEAR